MYWVAHLNYIFMFANSLNLMQSRWQGHYIAGHGPTSVFFLLFFACFCCLFICLLFMFANSLIWMQSCCQGHRIVGHGTTSVKWVVCTSCLLHKFAFERKVFHLHLKTSRARVLIFLTFKKWRTCMFCEEFISRKEEKVTQIEREVKYQRIVKIQILRRTNNRRAPMISIKGRW